MPDLSQVGYVISFVFVNSLTNQNLSNDFLSVFAPTLKADSQ